MSKSNKNEFITFADWLMTLSPFEFSTIGVITAYIISCNLTINQQNSIGNWLEMVGQIILTFNAQGSGQTFNVSENEYNELKNKVEYLLNKVNSNNC